MLQDTQIYSIIMFIQTILDSKDHMLTNISLHTRELLLHNYGNKAFVCPNYGMNYP